MARKPMVTRNVAIQEVEVYVANLETEKMEPMTVLVIDPETDDAKLLKQIQSEYLLSSNEKAIKIKEKKAIVNQKRGMTKVAFMQHSREIGGKESE